jgi:ribosomal protein S18 acetylase RimI-like enzyme
MKLIKTNDFELVKSKYLNVIKNTPNMEKYARWDYGKHPTDEAIRTYTDNGEMYILTDGENIAGMVALVMHQDQDYEDIAWAVGLESDQVATLHLLAVCPEFRGKCTGKKILDEAERLTVENGRKALRFDTLSSNLPAQRLYEKAGYSYRGKKHLYAENTGWTDFLYYEKVLIPEGI